MVSRLATNHQSNPASNKMIDISGLMNTLATQRKAYHSEADFQHTFAWEVHRQFPESSIRLESSLNVNSKPLHLDLLFRLSNRAMAVELKYKTRKLGIALDGEASSLASHSAQDIGRYDFIKDIIHFESIASNLANCEGYAVLLTNDSAYWKPRTQGTVDEAFSLT